MSYRGKWTNEEEEAAVAPLPSKKYAEKHKTEQRKRRTKKNGTFIENAIDLVQDKNIAYRDNCPNKSKSPKQIVMNRQLSEIIIDP